MCEVPLTFGFVSPFFLYITRVCIRMILRFYDASGVWVFEDFVFNTIWVCITRILQYVDTSGVQLF
jgi:hypothetical protein